MQSFIFKHTDKIHATLSCFDRLIFKVHLPFNYAESMEGFLAQQGILIKDFKKFVPKQAERIKLHAIELAARHGRPYEYLERYVRKEELARKIAKRDNVNKGLICVLAAVEPCQSFKIAYGKGKPRLRGARRKCLCLYFYYLDPTFGLMHVRIQTWFPFTVQIYLNGHEWLALQMEQAGLGFRQVENAFHWLEDPENAQRINPLSPAKPWRACFFSSLAFCPSSVLALWSSASSFLTTLAVLAARFEAPFLICLPALSSLCLIVARSRGLTR